MSESSSTPAWQKISVMLLLACGLVGIARVIPKESEKLSNEEVTVVNKKALIMVDDNTRPITLRFNKDGTEKDFYIHELSPAYLGMHRGHTFKIDGLKYKSLLGQDFISIDDYRETAPSTQVEHAKAERQEQIKVR